MSDWLTIEELAKQEGITIDGARKRAQRGQYERKKDGRRTLYRIFTGETVDGDGEGVDDGKGEGKGVSAQSAYLLAKAKKMQLDAERSELRLNRERLELYDDIRNDEMTAMRLVTDIIREGLSEILSEEQKRQYKKVLEEALKRYRERWKELRADHAEKVKSDVRLLNGYNEYCKQKHDEEQAAEATR